MTEKPIGKVNVMPSRYRVRRLFAPLVRQLARAFIALRVPPNVITLLSLLLAVLAAFLLATLQAHVPYALLVLVSGLLDGVDGQVARSTGRATPQGGYLDSMMDRAADVSLLLPYLWLPNPLPQLGPSWLWVYAAIAGCLLTSYTRSRATAAGATDTDVGLAARSERLLLLVVANLLQPLYPLAPHLGLILLTILSHLTTLYRAANYYRQITQPSTDRLTGPASVPTKH